MDVIHHINRVKKSHMILLIDAEKAYEKIEHSFMIKILNKLGIEEKFLNCIKSITQNPTLISYHTNSDYQVILS